MNLAFINKLIFRTPALPYYKKDKVNVHDIKEALYLASPVLTQEIDNLENGKLDKDEKQKRKINESIYKYYSRSCTRCTPFGLFAGVGTAEWGDESAIDLATERRRETRLDMNYVCALGQYVTSVKEIRDCLLFFPNDSIYAISDKIRYVDYKYIKTRRSHQISEVDNSQYLDRIIKRAERGALLTELAATITDDEIDAESAMNFVLEIVQAQLLKSELDPNVTGEYYFDLLLKRLIELQQTQLSESKHLQEIISILNEVAYRVRKIDQQYNNPVLGYKEIVSLIRKLPVGFEENNLFQTDLYVKTGRAFVSRHIQERLKKALDFLIRLSSVPRETAMTKFIEEYYKRYENEELPLQLVLDTELGIGYARNKGGDHNPLIDDIPFQQLHQQMQNKNGGILNYTSISLILRRKLMEANKSGQYIVEIMDEDFEDIPVNTTNGLPASFTVGFSLPSEEDQIILNFAGGEGAAKILGRFAGGHENVLEICKEIIGHENNFFSDKIVAEILHLPESRTGNILMRPAFREYEIPYLAKSNVSPDRIVSVSDLYISIRDGRELVLRSRKLNKEIIPRLTNAHNFSFNALPVYQFLCDLQSHNIRSFFSFDWGVFSSEYQFKPRAVYGKVILREATWNLRKKDIIELLDKEFDRDKIRHFLIHWNMPEIVLLTDADNTLMVEWYNELSFKTFISTVKKREYFTLTEHLFKNSIVKDENGNCYENEFLAFLLNNEILPKRVTSQWGNLETQRLFPIGSEWLYYKLYTGTKTSDKILGTYLKQTLEKLVEENLIEKWFFIRYADPEKHLRLRLHIPIHKNYETVISRIGSSVNLLMKERLIWKIQTDTYCREIERYGSLTIESCEEYFYHDSRFVLDIINSIDGEEGEKFRWIVGFRALDQLLTDFGMQLQEKNQFVGRLAEGFRKENGDGKALRIMLDNKFRALRKEIEFHLNRDNDVNSQVNALWNLVDQKTQVTQVIIQKIQELKDKNKLEVDYADLINSLIHMMLNRLFKSQQRLHELVIYDLLFHYYKSMLARISKKKKQLITAQ